MHGGFDRQRAPGTVARLVLRLALRELRGGLRGFGIFLACIALGVMAIAGVGSVSRSLTEGLAHEGRRILGGDVAVSLVQREASETERAYLATRGRLSAIATLRAMVVAGEKGSALVELKAVDAAYPTVGTLESEPQRPLAALLGGGDGVFGAVADPVLLARLDLKLGDRVRLGRAEIEIRASLRNEPDKIAAGVGFGPRLLVAQEALAASGLVQPGSLVRFTYRLTLPQADDAALAHFAEETKRALPDAGWDIRSRVNAAPQFARNIERFTQFLTLVGLTALMVGGVGVANAVRGFVERKRDSIATLKSLGAPGGRVVAIYLAQVLLIAVVGVGIGLALGAAMPFVLAGAARSLIPIPLDPALAPGELAVAALYGLLTALVFALAPLGRAHDVPVSALFRDQVDPERRLPRRRYLAALGLALAVLMAVAVFFAFDRHVAAIFIGAALGAFVLLRLVAEGIMALAARLPRPRRAAPRLALANIHRPGALTPSLVLSLGLGVTLLVALALVDANVRSQLTRALPGQSPSFFFLDIQNGEAERFAAFLAAEAPEARIERVPMMRGRIVSLKGIRVEDYKAPEQVAWVLEGDRGITHAAEAPEGSSLTSGAWWPKDYEGPPLVSFDREIAQNLGLSVGDKIVVNVLGRNLEATVANLRVVEWRRLGINFVMVFSPATFAGAPHTQLATLTLPNGGAAAQEAAILKATARAFPTVTSVRVKDALDAVNDIVGQLAVALRAASSIALAASLLVLAGALAAGHRARLYDAVILKTLGATRGRLLTAYALEYGALGLATALFGFLAGTVAAAVIVTRVMRLDFLFEPAGAILAAVLAVLVTIALGLVGTWRILGQKPAFYLRNL
ncbi:ABC transporter permease [Chelatococcus sp. SYSU_G07232]|uniref:ABC transporter permease n=1 Tax=Chelatococcus albus TaxID=3047466 RepID=A0ABT7AK53_9HYPH|nr:ABC transporter permease [Chelatococcus sp. SYSU_G07232]MDJ1159762.1 ABC transporter permease [Chelatococcus sp. SYSU_G07232]